MKKQHYSGVYYSVYPYAAEDYKVVRNQENSREWYYAMPFRLYKAATCKTKEATTLKEFLENIWETLDEAEHIIDDIHQPFTLNDLMVTPTKHLYGATNAFDGIYEVNEYFFVKTHTSWEVFCCWNEAVDYVFWNYPHISDLYIKGVDYTMSK